MDTPAVCPETRIEHYVDFLFHEMFPYSRRMSQQRKSKIENQFRELEHVRQTKNTFQ